MSTVPGSEKEYPAGLVLIAMGFTGADARVAQAFGLELEYHADAWQAMNA